MAKMSREQLLKMMPKGYDSGMFKQPNKVGPDTPNSKNTGKAMESK